MAGDDLSQSQPPTSGCPLHQWQEDFPVDWVDDVYVTRRDLTKILTFGSVLLAGATGLLAAIGLNERPVDFPSVRIASADAVTPGRSLLFRYPTDDDPCILVCDPEGQFRAYSQVCTHLACAVVYRREENVLFCPCHNGGFNVVAGDPIFGPPTRRLPRVRLERRGADLFAVGLEV